MSVKTEKDEISLVVGRLLDNMSLMVSSQTIQNSADLRRKIGDMKANYFTYLLDGTFLTKLLDCFTTARGINVKLASFVNVRVALFNESPVGEISKAIVQAGIGFCLSAESRIITAITFTSRDDVEAIMKTMKDAFDTAREIAADEINSASYQSLTFLAGALTNHLYMTAKPLPRMINFTVRATMPALTLSNLFYHTADRWEELTQENKTIHPAFCQRELRGLSA